jgi:hypothetical protein
MLDDYEREKPMDKDLNEKRKWSADSRWEYNHRRTKELGNLLANVQPQRILEGLLIEVPSARAVIKNAKGKFPTSPLDDAELARAINAYNALWQTAEVICNEHPEILRQRIQEFENLDDSKLGPWTTQSLEQVWRLKLGGFRNDAEILRRLQSDLNNAERFIREKLSRRVPPAPGHGVQPAALSPKEIESRPEPDITSFDPRF